MTTNATYILRAEMTLLEPAAAAITDASAAPATTPTGKGKGKRKAVLASAEMEASRIDTYLRTMTWPCGAI